MGAHRVAERDLGLIGLLDELKGFGVDAGKVEQRARELHDAAHRMSILGIDISEIYSPPRIVALAEQYRLRPGFSLDLTTHDAEGIYGTSTMRGNV